MMSEADHVETQATHRYTVSGDERSRMAGAVRESVRLQVMSLLRRAGVSPEDIECPRCGDRVINLDRPRSFVWDARHQVRICRPCAAERDFNRLVHPQTDLGGEGGA